MNSGGRDSGDYRQGTPTQNGPAHSAIPKSIVKREKTLVALPTQYAAGDADHDGQIALSEWKVWKGRAALAEFSRLDTNGDGFLTPRELVAASKGNTAIAATTTPAAPTTGVSAAQATPATATATATATASTPAGAASTNPAAATDAKPAEARPAETKSGEADPAKPAASASPALKAEADDFSEFDGLPETSTPTPAEPTGKAADDAKRYFDILDKDGDGKVSPKEWAASTRIRGDFTKAKIDLTQPIPRADFIAHYVRLNP